MLSSDIPLPTVLDAAIKQSFMDENTECSEAQTLRQAVRNLNERGCFIFNDEKER